MFFENEKYKNEYINKGDLLDKMMSDCNPEHFPRAAAKDVFTCAIANVEVATPADVMPVIYARWEPIHDVFADDVFKCSHCGTWNNVKTVMGKPDWKFCPECGARMNIEV